MLAGLLTATSLLVLGAGTVQAADFPPFLPELERFPAEIRNEITSIWTGHTLTRAVSGEPARAPLELFQLFVDLPEVTAAAARHLGLVQYRVRQLRPDHYEAEDGEGARGTYRVLVRETHRRVMLTRGSHASRILGRVTGASLTILDFVPETGTDGDPQISQRVETFVRIDNRLTAFIARILLPFFSSYADRKIAETFNVTARVSAWAHGEPTTFCVWLANQPEGVRHRAEFAPLLAPCG